MTKTPVQKRSGRSLPRGPKLEPAAQKDAERIAKVMARVGVASRREAETLIEQGRVSVNGKVISSPALNVSARDRIVIDGKPLPQRERTRLFLFHKPRGLVTTRIDPQGRPTIYSVLPSDLPRLVSVGRLDLNTEGLLLLTNDGGLKRVLELPATGWLRRYRVRAFGRVMQPQLDALRKGIEVDGVRYGPIDAALEREQGDNVWLTFAMREGKNREIRNVMRALGLQVNRLIRVSYGPFQLGEMAEGAVEEVRTRMLRDQLGERLAAAAGADFAAPLAEREPVERPERERPKREARFGHAKSGEGRTSESKPRDTKPRGAKFGDAKFDNAKFRGNRSRDDKLRGGKTRDDKFHGGKSAGGKSPGVRSSEGRSSVSNARHGQSEPGSFQRSRSPAARPPRAGEAADRNAMERPRRARPQGGKPDNKPAGKPFGRSHEGSKGGSRGESHGFQQHGSRESQSRGFDSPRSKPHGSKPDSAKPRGAKPHGAKRSDSKPRSFGTPSERPQQDRRDGAPRHRNHPPHRGKQGDKHGGPRPSRPRSG